MPDRGLLEHDAIKAVALAPGTGEPWTLTNALWPTRPARSTATRPSTSCPPTSRGRCPATPGFSSSSRPGQPGRPAAHGDAHGRRPLPHAPQERARRRHRRRERRRRSPVRSAHRIALVAFASMREGPRLEFRIRGRIGRAGPRDSSPRSTPSTPRCSAGTRGSASWTTTAHPASSSTPRAPNHPRPSSGRHARNAPRTAARPRVAGPSQPGGQLPLRHSEGSLTLSPPEFQQVAGQE